MPTLDWIGKKAVENHHLEIPFRMLKSNPDLSVGDVDSGNLIVQGDNLEALKALLPYYAGKVKFIYIDPPYNTGKENWTYNDNVNSPEIKEWLFKVVGKEGEDLSRHDKWLCMMYPRLSLLKKFLVDDGVIFVSIDDNEIHNLTNIMNEIFGENNKLANIVWDLGTGTTAGHFTRAHEYVLLYSKNKKLCPNFKNFQNDEKILHGALKKPSRANPFSQIEFPAGIEYEGDNAVFKGEIGGSEKVKIISDKMEFENGKLKKPVILEAGWAMRNQILSWLDGEITYDSKGQLVKRFYFNKKGILWYEKDKDVINPQTVIRELASTKDGSTLLNNIMGEKVFNFPKPIELISFLMKLATEKNSLILDSFAGSGTTAHAALELNTKDNGDRRFILIEMDKVTCQELTSERIKRVIKGYVYKKKKGEDIFVKGLNGSFKYCNLDVPLFDESNNIRPDVKFADLAYHIFFSETGTPLSSNSKIGKTPYIGKFKDTAYYLLFNGILGDKSISGGNILTSVILEKLIIHKGKKIIFGEGCRISSQRLKKENIVFKQIPYEIKVK